MCPLDPEMLHATEELTGRFIGNWPRREEYLRRPLQGRDREQTRAQGASLSFCQSVGRSAPALPLTQSHVSESGASLHRRWDPGCASLFSTRLSLDGSVPTSDTAASADAKCLFVALTWGPTDGQQRAEYQWLAVLPHSRCARPWPLGDGSSWTRARLSGAASVALQRRRRISTRNTPSSVACQLAWASCSD